MFCCKQAKNYGFTLIEVIVATAVFLIVAVGIYNGLASAQNLSLVSRQKMVAIALADEQLEVIRNLPYSDVGLVGGLPVGKLLHEKAVSRNNLNFVITTTVRNIDDPFDGLIGGLPNDLNPADYKLVEVTISCPSCRVFSPITINTTVAPKGLETNSGNGALFVRVIDSNGLPVEGVAIHIVNASSSITIDDTTGNTGQLQLVDVPPGNFAYRISVSKSGYTSGRTYSSDDSNLPNPYLPDATVAVGQVTQITFIIEHLSDLTIKTMNDKCEAIGSFSFRLSGTKLLGTEPPVLAYDQEKTTDTAGNLNLTGLIWDNYQFLPQDATRTIIGTLPPEPINLPAGSNLWVGLVLAPKDPNGLVVRVKDGITGLPVSGATVKITSPSGVIQSKLTSRGFINQTEWSTTEDNIDNNIEINNPTGELKLKQALGQFVSSGEVISRVFDTGSASSTYYNLGWQPGSQATSTGEESVRFQIASGNDPATSTWYFLGPDGTALTYYTTSGSTISNKHDNQRYVKYRVLISTNDSLSSPEISDVYVTYGSECIPAGQVFFGGLDSGLYNVTVSKGGYQEHYGSASTTAEWQGYEALINPL